MRTYIERVEDKALLVSNTKVREKALDRSLKRWNLNLYYGHLHIEYYYFHQQCKNYFEFARSLGYKRIIFATDFSRARIHN